MVDDKVYTINAAQINKALEDEVFKKVNGRGFVENVQSAVEKWGNDKESVIHPKGNIIMLAGGSARIPNVANRLQKEVDKFFGEEIFKVIVEDKPELTV